MTHELLGIDVAGNWAQMDRLGPIGSKLVGARDAIKLALPGFRRSVEWWGLPARLEWALAPDRGAGVTKLGPWLRAWLSGVCVGLGCRN